jgi:hypothetical protein
MQLKNLERLAEWRGIIKQEVVRRYYETETIIAIYCLGIFLTRKFMEMNLIVRILSR